MASQLKLQADPKISQGPGTQFGSATLPEILSPLPGQEDRPPAAEGSTLINPISPLAAIARLEQGENIDSLYYTRSDGSVARVQKVTDPEVTAAWLRTHVSADPDHRIGGAKNPLSLRMVVKYPELLSRAMKEPGQDYIKEPDGTVRPITSKDSAAVVGYAARELGLPVPDETLRRSLLTKTTMNAYEVGRALYAAGFRDDALKTMIAVCLHESGTNDGRNLCVRNAYNGISRGIAQINDIHGFANMDDPYANARAAKHVWELQGPKAWVSYTHNRHVQYLDEAEAAVSRIAKEQAALAAL